MRNTSVESNEMRRWALLFLLLVAAAVALRTPLQLAGRWYNPDEAQYAATIAFQAESAVSWGEVLGTGPNRPPLMAVYTLSDYLFGHYPWLALDIAHSIIIGVTAGLLSLVSVQLLALGWGGRVLIGVVFIVHSYPFNEGWTNNTEHMANLLKVAFLALWLWGNRLNSPLWRSISYLLLGLAVSTKMQQIPLVLCGPAFWYLATEGPRRLRDFALEMLWSAMFFSMPFVIFSLTFSLLIGGVSTYNLAYFFSRMYGYGDLLHRFSERFLQDPITLSAALVSAPVLLQGLLKWSFPPDRSGQLRPLYLASCLFLLEVLSILPGLRFPGHYFILLAPGALLVVTVGVHLLLQSSSIRPVSIAVGFLVLFSLQVSHVTPMYDEYPGRTEALGWIQEHSAPDERIFVWGWEPELYAFSGRIPASRFVITNYVVNDIQAASDLPPYNEQALRVMLRDLELNPPSLFIIVKWNWHTFNNERYAIDNLPALRSYVEQHFPGPPVQENDRYLILKRGDG